MDEYVAGLIADALPVDGEDDCPQARGAHRHTHTGDCMACMLPAQPSDAKPSDAKHSD